MEVVLRDEMISRLAYSYEFLRTPETGLVTVRGRIGSTGRAFNLGDVTVSRATLRLECGGGPIIGIARILGRDRDRAEIVALLDALLQLPTLHERLYEEHIAPLQRAQAARRAEAAADTAATRVEFSVMTRGE
ncbi:alpha-D-ribose 1-methylphosphonate 5-triphosphate synthase subunit PhnG [Sphingobium sp. OAS761]|nr:alpha-D-ribose 1-methylphosphonate 5-triphosphate synthase subunit PhnG [Sphingobium sp. OAS761]